MALETLTERMLKFAVGVCFVAFGLANWLVLGFDLNTFLSFQLITSIIEGTQSFLGAIAFVGFVASLLTQVFFDEGLKNWKVIAGILTLWLAFINLNRIPLPKQTWVYLLGLVLATLVTVALAFALISTGPTLARILGSVALVVSVVFTLLAGFLAFSSPLLERSLKRVDINTPYEFMEALEAIRQSSAAEDKDGSFQQVQRFCEPKDAICFGDIALYEIPAIIEQLGMEDLEWRPQNPENFPMATNAEIYYARYRQLEMFLAQAQGKTYATAIDLSKLNQEQRERTSFVIP